jgi:hypothetical protein
MFTVFGETWRILPKLQKPARHSFAHEDTLFETRATFGGKSYITSISTEKCAESRPMGSCRTSCKYVIVWLDKFGITKIHFAYGNEAPPAPDRTMAGRWVYAFAVTGESLHVESKVR